MKPRLVQFAELSPGLCSPVLPGRYVTRVVWAPADRTGIELPDIPAGHVSVCQCSWGSTGVVVVVGHVSFGVFADES